MTFYQNIPFIKKPQFQIASTRWIRDLILVSSMSIGVAMLIVFL